MTSPAASDALIHYAAVYTSAEDYIGAVLPFLYDGLTVGDPVLVMAPTHNIDLLKARLDRSANRVTFLDTAGELRNPARLISTSHRLAKSQPGRRIRVVGEAIWPGRTAAEIREGVRHEACVNILSAERAVTVFCPYDARLDAPVIEDGGRNHPHRLEGGDYRTNPKYVDPAVTLSMRDPLPAAPAHAERMDFRRADLKAVRHVVRDRASRAGISEERVSDLLLAVYEVATNSLAHTGGPGILRIWRDPEALLCEIFDNGHITDPLVGRVQPLGHAESGRGLWMVNQLCDLVEVRSAVAGTTIRMHTALN